jgi:hypothetical protein
MKRFIFSDNGTLKDKTINLEKYHSDSEVIDYVTSNDAIYIGSELPFNSLFFDVAVSNTTSGNISIKYWDATTWRSMVETFDETEVGGIPFSTSGHITWVPDRNYLWAQSNTTYPSGTEQITGLGNITIYDLYWIKIEYDATLDNTLELNWIGPKFCHDNDLTGEYTLFSNSTFKSNYLTGKTDWENEIIIASRIMIEDIINKGVISGAGQLLKRRKLRDACVSKTAQLIFKNLGDDYKDDAERAWKEYKDRLSMSNYGADLNNNATFDTSVELGVKTGVLFR